MSESNGIEGWSHSGLKPIGAGIVGIILGITIEAASLAPNNDHLRPSGALALLIGGSIIYGTLVKIGLQAESREQP